MCFAGLERRLNSRESCRIVFFGLGAVSVGLIVPYNSEGLLGSGSDATASPYVISMQNLGISGLPVSSFDDFVAEGF